LYLSRLAAVKEYAYMKVCLIINEIFYFRNVILCTLDFWLLNLQGKQKLVSLKNRIVQNIGGKVTALQNYRETTFGSKYREVQKNQWLRFEKLALLYMFSQKSRPLLSQPKITFFYHFDVLKST